MIIGFTQRRWTVSESDGTEGANTFSLTLNVRSLRLSELEYELLFRVLETGNATVEASNLQFQESYDALFGSTDSEQDPIVNSQILAVHSLQLTTLLDTQIVNDVRPESALKCFDIRILSPDLGREAGVESRNIFTCIEDEDNPVNFFCKISICIEDDDG